MIRFIRASLVIGGVGAWGNALILAWVLGVPGIVRHVRQFLGIWSIGTAVIVGLWAVGLWIALEDRDSERWRDSAR